MSVPYGTDFSTLVASFTTTGVSVAVGGLAQTSGTTANASLLPLSYLVTAEDGSTQTYTVTVVDFTSTGAGESLAATSDFSHIIAGSHGSPLPPYAVWRGYIFTSSDNGATWSKNTTAYGYNVGSMRILDVTCSSDFTKLGYCINQYTSTWICGGAGLYPSLDGGTSWNFISSYISDVISVSPDGSTYLAGANINQMYSTSTSAIHYSTDGGTTWTASTSSGTHSWYDLVWSSDGSVAVAAPTDGSITISKDKGVTWTATGSASADWRSVAVSPNGSRMVAVDHNGTTGGYIYLSADGGATWSPLTSAGSKLWLSVAMSADGSTIAAGTDGGYLYTSKDSGSTWVAHVGMGSGTWNSIICNSAGSKIIAANGSTWVSN